MKTISPKFNRFHHSSLSDIPVAKQPMRQVLKKDGDYFLYFADDSLPEGDMRDYSIENLQRSGIPITSAPLQNTTSFDDFERGVVELSKFNNQTITEK